MDTLRLAYRYKVLVVDDEPMAVRAICRIIEKSCPSFEVAGEAVKGEKALEQIRQTNPDVVLTDIEMPLMNGLEMARRAKEIYPDLCFVVISGYQDYEYMRQAIQSGVLDYLAKPIVPSAITAMMERVREKLAVQFYERRNEVLRRIGQGQTITQDELARYFPFRLFYAGLVRENGLPRRFGAVGEPELFGTGQEAFSVYGRDSREQLFIIPAAMLEHRRIWDYLEEAGNIQKQAGSYMTILYYSRPFTADAIAERVSGLYRGLILEWISMGDNRYSVFVPYEPMLTTEVFEAFRTETAMPELVKEKPAEGYCFATKEGMWGIYPEGWKNSYYWVFTALDHIAKEDDAAAAHIFNTMSALQDDICQQQEAGNVQGNVPGNASGNASENASGNAPENARGNVTGNAFAGKAYQTALDLLKEYGY